jgi:Protein of unknown function (DUF2905)
MAVWKVLVLFGLLLVGGGVLLWWGIPVGRLPGDVVVRRGPVTFYLPVTTSVLVSLLVTLILTLFRR